MAQDFLPKLGVTRYVGIVANQRGVRFMVFETGDPRFYLFNRLYPGKTILCTTMHIPVRKTNLRDDVRKALAHGLSMR